MKKDPINNSEDSGALDGAENNNATPTAPSASSGVITPEMLKWLTDNREDYEFYLLHAMMHDPTHRASLLAVPVTPDDFRLEEQALVIGAITAATKIMGVIEQTLPNPPTPEFLRTYVDSAAREEASEDEVIEDAMKLVNELQDPAFKEAHYCVGPYFEAWYGSQRAKKAARELQKMDIPDVTGILEHLQMALDAASQAGAMAEQVAFDFDDPPERPDPILKLGDDIICTPGNISNIQGPSKAGKSAVIDAILAACMSQPWIPVDTLGFTAARPEGRAVVHFDTEQSAFDHDGLIRRAYERANRRDRAVMLHSYCLTGMEPTTCWDFLEQRVKAAAEDHNGVMMVLIDGIADFCADPNDAEECFSLIRRLHRLAARHECVVLSVLHENPGINSQGKTRGHLGSQLARKAETSLRVVKDIKTGISTIWADNARHCFIPKGAGWRFQWSDEARKHVSLRGDELSSAATKPDRKLKYTAEVSMLFHREEGLSYAELTQRIVQVLHLAESTAKTRIREYLEYGLIEKDSEGKHRIVRSTPTE